MPNFALRMLSVILISLPSWLFVWRKRKSCKNVRKARSQRGRCQKGRRAGRGTGGRKKGRELGERVRDVFPFMLFSLPPSPSFFAPVMQATRRAPYSARNFGAHLRARQMQSPATQATFQIISNCYCILLLSPLVVLPNKGSCTSSSPPAFCFGRRTTNCGDLEALGTY